MKIYLWIAILGLFLIFNKAYSIEWNDFSYLEIREMQSIVKHKKKLREYQKLKDAKIHLINGNIDKAINLLQSFESDSKLNILVKRYLAISYFIKNQYQKGRKLLADPRFDRSSYSKKICLLKIIYSLGQERDLDERQFRNCKISTLAFSNNNWAWADFIKGQKNKKMKVASGPRLNGKGSRGDDEILKIWLKMILYTNQENKFVDIINSLSTQNIKTEKVRELISFVFFRLGIFQKALNFMEDINTANTENMRGNIYLLSKQFELAFAQFALALRKKSNSVNALERIIPLSWKLNKFKEGLYYINRYTDNQYGKVNLLTLDTVFSLRNGQFKQARRKINTLKRWFNNLPPVQIMAMESYVDFMLSLKGEKTDYAKNNSELCKRRMGINCWIELLYGQGVNIEREVTLKTPIKSLNEWDLETLKQEAKQIPIDELLIIDQKDIDELDGQVAIKKFSIDPYQTP